MPSAGPFLGQTGVVTDNEIEAPALNRRKLTGREAITTGKCEYIVKIDRLNPFLRESFVSWMNKIMKSKD